MDKLDARKLTVEGHGLLRQMVIRFRKHSGMNVKELAVAAAHAAKRGIQPQRQQSLRRNRRSPYATFHCPDAGGELRQILTLNIRSRQPRTRILRPQRLQVARPKFHLAPDRHLYACPCLSHFFGRCFKP